jgi:hypothetical protein
MISQRLYDFLATLWLLVTGPVGDIPVSLFINLQPPEFGR